MIKKSSIRVISYCCQLEQRFNEFSLLSSLFRQLLRFDHNENTQYDREQYLSRLFDINKSHDLYLRRNLFLLNDLLDVRFRRSHIETENTNEKNFVRTYETNINELLLHILNQLIEPSTNTGETLRYACTIKRTHTKPFLQRNRNLEITQQSSPGQSSAIAHAYAMSLKLVRSA